jgi:uncharacterized protein YecE (DUF72 family)
MIMKVGCCGFSEAHHKYFSHFDLVEIQSTFYQPPRLGTATKWRESAPEGFEFTIKAWQLITHKPTRPTYRRLREPISQQKKPKFGFFKPTKEVFKAWEVTKEVAVSLKTKYILFQCPPNFRATDENINNLKRFFTSIDRTSLNLVWEPRGEWCPNLVKDICHELNLIHCVDPFRNESLTDTFKYYRLHGLKGYRYKYTNEDLSKLKEICCQSETVYCFFNNVTMKDDALRFKNLINS